ncbi:MAG: hypothetical protein ACJ8R9_18810 [Steroidobacteraceae bacterium]
MQCRWHPDIQALSFELGQHAGRCFVHRRAFQTLLGFAPSSEDCENYFVAQYLAFHSAAAAKIVACKLESPANFHLNSRDIKRSLE